MRTVVVMALLLPACARDLGMTERDDPGLVDLAVAEPARSFGWRAVDQVQVGPVSHVGMHDDGRTAHATMGGVTCLWRDGEAPIGDPDTGTLDTAVLGAGAADTGTDDPPDTGLGDTGDPTDDGGFDEDEDVEEGDEEVSDGGTDDELGGTTALRTADGVTLLVERGVSDAEPLGVADTFGPPNSWAIHRIDGVGHGGVFLDDGRYADFTDTADGCRLRLVHPDGARALGATAPFDCPTVMDTASRGPDLFVSAGGGTFHADLEAGTLVALDQPSIALAWNAAEDALVLADGDRLTSVGLDGTERWSVAAGEVFHVQALPSGEVVTGGRQSVERWSAGERVGRYASGLVYDLDVSTRTDRVVVASGTGMTVLEPARDRDAR